MKPIETSALAARRVLTRSGSCTAGRAALGAGIAVMGLVLCGACGCRERPKAVVPVAGESGVGQVSDDARLVGTWRRPDGGYVLKISSVDDHGIVDAAYFNPKPIHVAQARVTRDAATSGVFVELRDINYPGSAYRLAYDQAADCLRGTYFQAVDNQSYDVFFERVKP